MHVGGMKSFVCDFEIENFVQWNRESITMAIAMMFVEIDCSFSIKKNLIPILERNLVSIPILCTTISNSKQFKSDTDFDFSADFKIRIWFRFS